jgi:hypothetical protein
MTARRRGPAAPAIALLVALVVVTALTACVPPPVARGTPSPVANTAPPATATPTALPTGPTAAPSFVRPVPTALPTFLGYVVKGGDTLDAIAKAHRTTVSSLAFWNRARYPSLDPDSPEYDPDRIEVGWLLLLVPDSEIDEDLTFP